MDIEKTADLKCISRFLVEKWHVDQVKMKITVSPAAARSTAAAAARRRRLRVATRRRHGRRRRRTASWRCSAQNCSMNYPIALQRLRRVRQPLSGRAARAELATSAAPPLRALVLSRRPMDDAPLRHACVALVRLLESPTFRPPPPRSSSASPPLSPPPRSPLSPDASGGRDACGGAATPPRTPVRRPSRTPSARSARGLS